jgi:hypothetical protein
MLAVSNSNFKTRTQNRRKMSWVPENEGKGLFGLDGLQKGCGTEIGPKTCDDDVDLFDLVNYALFIWWRTNIFCSTTFRIFGVFLSHVMI